MSAEPVPPDPKRGWTLRETDRCKHTKSPHGYLLWSEWAEKKAQTHTQHRCPICGLWAIWKPKDPTAKTETQP